MVAVAALHSNSVFVECGSIRPLVMLLNGWGYLSAEKARWHWRWIIRAGYLLKPCVGCRSGEVELPYKNSDASWNEVIGR